jgi:hypothetical protein
MRATSKSRQDSPNDVGTLWSMVHRDSSARCALMAWPEDWELRVLVDGEALLSERCDRADEAFQLAEQWKQRMLAHGWRQVLPRSGNTAGALRQHPADHA